MSMSSRTPSTFRFIHLRGSAILSSPAALPKQAEHQIKEAIDVYVHGDVCIRSFATRAPEVGDGRAERVATREFDGRYGPAS